MATLLTCRDYSVIGFAPDDSNLPLHCERHEQARNDGYAVIASIDGQIVACASGWEDGNDGGPPYDAATATGMYDRY